MYISYNIFNYVMKLRLLTIFIFMMLSSLVMSQDIPKEKIRFSISPNPASTVLHIKVSTKIQKAKIIVFNVLGKKVYAKDLNTLSPTIDVSKWNSGVYLVKISSENFSQTKRFVKQ